MLCEFSISIFFFFNDTATTEIYTLSLHDALPIWLLEEYCKTCRLSNKNISWVEDKNYGERTYTRFRITRNNDEKVDRIVWHDTDRKSTRLNSSHGYISYAVFCLKKKKKTS